MEIDLSLMKNFFPADFKTEPLNNKSGKNVISIENNYSGDAPRIQGFSYVCNGSHNRLH